MTLAAVLSALRSIVLDAPALPPEEDARRTFYRRQFPALSDLEAADLAKMPPERLAIYTRSIFTGEANILETIFRMAAAALAREAQQRGKRFKLRDAVRAMHHVHPWTTKTTEGLVESFERFLAHPAFDVGLERDLIREIAAFERHLFYARRLPWDECSPRRSLRLEQLRNRTVGDILALPYALPATTSLGLFHWDIAAAHSVFKRDGSLPEQIEERLTHLIFSRDCEHYIHWTELPEAVFKHLSSTERGAHTLAGMAEAFVVSHPAPSDEARMFADFLNLLDTLVSNGALVLREVDPE